MAVKVALVTLGCSKNQVDAERILYTLYNEGFEILADLSGADVVVVNTCAFIDSAKSEGIECILEYAELKKEGRLKGVVVTGCMAQRYAGEIEEKIPQVNCVISPGYNAEIGLAVTTAAEGGRLHRHNAPERLELTGGRICSTPKGWAYLKIADGCSNKCAYCTIPDIRGAYRSVPVEALVQEASELADGGAKELTLIAQDTSMYGTDIYGKPSLPMLLQRLEEVRGLEWIRLLYLYPAHINGELIEAVKSLPKVVPYLDIPIQHSDGEVLRSMNRPGGARQLLELVERLRNNIKNLTLRTTVMVGYPTETKQAFDGLMDFLRQARFDRAGCFVFSPQEGTPAAGLKGTCSAKTALRRERLVMELSQQINAQNQQKKAGTLIKALTEGYDRYAGHWYGRGLADAPEVDGKIFFTGEGVKAGEFVNVRITDAMGLDLVGVKED